MDIVNTFLLITLNVFIICFFILGFVIHRSTKLSRSINKFENYVSVLEYHMNKAYELIYKDKLLIYSYEGMKINDEQFSMISKQYAMLVLKLLGPTMAEEFKFIYGNEDTLLFNIDEYFHTKYENDEIQKASVEKMMNQEGNEDSMKIFE